MSGHTTTTNENRSATFQVATPARCWRYIYKGDFRSGLTHHYA
jgi:hypothetical protein